jgi:3-oxoacyl-[acyl-carrier protein] reductase
VGHFKPQASFTIGGSVKAACAALAKALADLGKQDGVQVNCIHPILVDTDRQRRRIQAEMERTGQSEATIRRQFCREMGTARSGTVEDVANLACFIVSRNGGWLHGASIGR